MQRLRLYIHITLGGGIAPEIPREALGALDAYFSVGGRLDLLCETVRLLANAQTERHAALPLTGDRDLD